MKKTSSEITSQHINDVVNYLESHTQFTFKFDEKILELTQKEDSKSIAIDFEKIEKILIREDVDGSKFLQVNFFEGNKILITRSLVGFKPSQLIGFDLTRIPRVVTTIDLVSVAKAIEDLYDTDDTADSKAEIEILKKVYQSILYGAEGVGFKMQAEKTWISAILLNQSAMSA